MNGTVSNQLTGVGREGSGCWDRSVSVEWVVGAVQGNPVNSMV